MPEAKTLPPLDDLFVGDEAARQAYTRLLSLENQQELPIKILGQMLIQAPSSAGRAHVVGKISDCANNQALLDLGQSYLSHFIAYFHIIHLSKASRSRFADESPASPVDDDQTTTNPPVPAVSRYAEAKKQALIRDNYRCMLSGTIDMDSVPSIPGLMDEVINSPKTLVKRTYCCHILSQYFIHGITEPGTTASVGTIADLFGGIPDNEMDGPWIHDLSNVMTLDTKALDCFINLEIWLEPVEGANNTYGIHRRYPYLCWEFPSIVTFSSPSDDLPLPDPRYLALHAACARVIEASDAESYIRRILDDAEEKEVLSEDRSSGKLLSQLLLRESIEDP